MSRGCGNTIRNLYLHLGSYYLHPVTQMPPKRSHYGAFPYRAAAVAHSAWRHTKGFRSGYKAAKSVADAIRSAKRQRVGVANPNRYRIHRDTATKTLYRKKRLSRFQARRRRRIIKRRHRLIRFIKGKQPINTHIQRTITPQLAQWISGGTDFTNQLVLGAADPYGCWTPAMIETLRSRVQPVHYRLNRGAGVADYSVDQRYLHLMITHMSHTMHIKNISGADGLLVDVYTCLARHSTSDSSIGNPKDTWTSCLLQGEPSTISLFSPATKSVTPFDCPKFGRIWKILNVERLKFDNLESKTVQMKCRPGKIRLEGGSSGHYTIRGKTMYWLLVIHPTPHNFTFIANQSLLEIAFVRTTRFVPVYSTGSFLGIDKQFVMREDMATPGTNS